MLRTIPNQLQGSCVGPVVKPLNATNHDFIGNPLETVTQIHDGTHGVQALAPGSLVIGTLSGGFSSFSLGGNSYTVSALQVVYVYNSAPHGQYAFVLITVLGSTILTDLQNNGLDETLGIRFTGSRGTETYTATSSNKWRNPTNAATDRIELTLINENTTSGFDNNTFLAWEANSAYWGVLASNNQTDTTSVASFIT